MSQFFREVSKHRALVEKHKNLFQLFCAAFEVTDNLNEISYLQKEFITTELCYSYSYFGYCLFATSAIELSASGLAKICAVDPDFIKKYMLNLKEFLLDETQLEKKEFYFSPQNLERSFAKEFVKRFYCTSEDEDMQTGMGIFNRNSLGNLLDDSMYNEFVLFYKEVKRDPLHLIVSRFESFINIFKNQENSLFVFKEQNNLVDEKSQKISAILSLLVSHKHKLGHLLHKDNMLTAVQLSKLFSPKFKSEFFNLQPIKAWFGEYSETDLKLQIESLLEEALKSGVVFKIPQGSKDYSYGLSENGLKIIEPFHSILTDSLSVVCSSS